MVGVHADAKAHAQHAFLAGRERGQNAGRGFLQVFLNGAVERQNGVLVLDEIAKLAVFLVADGGFQRNRLLGDLHHLADLFQRHLQLFGQFLGRGFAADLVQHLAAGAHQLVDRFDHMDRDTDRACLIGDRAGDRLTDPPCGIGRELVAAAVFELIDRFHQADVALLDQVEELQPAVGVFLGDGDHEAQVRLDHFLFRLTGFFLALLDLVHDATEFADIKAHILAHLRHVGAEFLDLVARTFHQRLPATARFRGHAFAPCRIKLAVAVFVDELAAVDAGLIGQLHHGAVDGHDPAVDAVKLIDQRLDAVVVQMQFVDQLHDFRAQRLIDRLVFLRKAGILVQRGRDPLVLHLGQLDVIIGDPVEGFENPRLECGFHRGKAHIGLLVVILVIIAIARQGVAVGV